MYIMCRYGTNNSIIIMNISTTIQRCIYKYISEINHTLNPDAYVSFNNTGPDLKIEDPQAYIFNLFITNNYII